MVVCARKMYLIPLSGSPRSCPYTCAEHLFWKLVNTARCHSSGRTRGRCLRRQIVYESHTVGFFAFHSTMCSTNIIFCWQMHELLVSRGFVRRPTPVTSADENSTNEGGSVRDQPSEEERRRMDAATAERKLKSAEARAVRTCMPVKPSKCSRTLTLWACA